MPLLLFWVIAGLRAAFAFPMDLAAGWVFRVTGVRSGMCRRGSAMGADVRMGRDVSASLAALRLAGWDLRRLLVQLVCGLCLCTLLTDGFFMFHKGVPFNQPRMPGTKSLPLMLTLYVGVLPPALFGFIRLEMHYERSPLQLLLLGLGVTALHLGLARLQTAPKKSKRRWRGTKESFKCWA